MTIQGLLPSLLRNLPCWSVFPACGCSPITAARPDLVRRSPAPTGRSDACEAGAIHPGVHLKTLSPRSRRPPRRADPTTRASPTGSGGLVRRRTHRLGLQLPRGGGNSLRHPRRGARGAPSGLSDDDLRSVFGGTALAFYPSSRRRAKPMPERTVPRTVLADHPHTAKLKSGGIRDARVDLSFTDIAPVHRAFAPMVREEAYDLSELAVVTALQANAFGRPVVLLHGRGGRALPARLVLSPAPHDRSRRNNWQAPASAAPFVHPQTTGMWVRAHPRRGLRSGGGRHPLGSPHDEPHVAQYTDPDFRSRAGAAGTPCPICCARGGSTPRCSADDLPRGEEFVRVVPDAEARDEQWWRRRRYMPVNAHGRRRCVGLPPGPAGGPGSVSPSSQGR
ncbi:hypothetical protein ACRAWF_47085 [Streptomyces sp. L7]